MNSKKTFHYNQLKEQIKSKTKNKKEIKCNICGNNFSPSSRHGRYCIKCKIESETFRFADWQIC
jgi:formylmethanofuran dehydrogenase subunit E